MVQKIIMVLNSFLLVELSLDNSSSYRSLRRLRLPLSTLRTGSMEEHDRGRTTLSWPSRGPSFHSSNCRNASTWAATEDTATLNFGTVAFGIVVGLRVPESLTMLRWDMTEWTERFDCQSCRFSKNGRLQLSKKE